MGSTQLLLDGCLVRRADDLTLVTMRKPGEQLTWDNQSFKKIPEYSGVPQCVWCCFC